MTLFLTSDEMVYGSTNTRTSFDNCIQQDFFSEQGRNVALKEIFFDAKFPTLINNSFPHAITLIDGREHSIDEFPAKGLGTDCEAKKKARSTCTIWVKLCPAVQGYTLKSWTRLYPNPTSRKVNT